ncbi:MAG TPA: ParA family protein [Gammaproteobacteria bacterium]
MNTTLVINTKGGVGKTTITTNIASYFAGKNVRTAIMDFDPQGSSLHWLKQRKPYAPQIHGANAAPKAGAGLQSVQRFLPAGIEQLVLDAPAGVSKLLLQDLLNRTNCILIPVAPSTIDIHATANFIKELLLVGRIRHRNIRLAVIANRVRTSTAVYEPLERFVASLGLSFLTRILDSEAYVEAVETGKGVFEMDAELHADRQREFLPIVHWIDEESSAKASAPSNVIPLAQARA